MAIEEERTVYAWIRKGRFEVVSIRSNGSEKKGLTASQVFVLFEDMLNSVYL